MGNFNLFDFLNAVNNNPAAKNALDKIFSKNANPSGGENANGKERLRPPANGAAQRARGETNAKNQADKNATAKKANAAAKPPRYSDNTLTEILKRHDALSKQIDEQNGGAEKSVLTEKENHLTFPSGKM